MDDGEAGIHFMRDTYGVDHHVGSDEGNHLAAEGGRSAGTVEARDVAG